MGMVNKKSTLYLVLFSFFFVTCWSLGYSTLNRYSPDLLMGLSDTAIYYSLVENGLGSIEYDLNNRSNRILVPLIARMIYLYIPTFGTWDPIGHALLITTSVFSSLAALMIFNLSLKMFDNIHLSLIASFLYLTNFIVINWYLVGGVDSAWSLCCISLFYILVEKKYYLLPYLSVLATLTKEHFLLFGLLIIFLWILYEYIYENKFDIKFVLYFFLTLIISLSIVLLLYYFLKNQVTMPWQIMNDVPVLSSKYDLDYLISRVSRFLLVLGPLLLLSIPNLKIFSSKLLFSIGITVLTQLVLGTMIDLGGAGHGRSMFNLASFVICTGAAMTVFNLINNKVKQ
jgi:hypothetical protein